MFFHLAAIIGEKKENSCPATPLGSRRILYSGFTAVQDVYAAKSISASAVRTLRRAVRLSSKTLPDRGHAGIHTQ
jgi:hypothetical protein